MTEVRLGLGATTVLVRSESALAARWLVEFCCPPFEACAEAGGAPLDATISAHVDPRRCADLLARGREGGPEVACLTLDGGHQRLPLWLEEGPLAVLRDAREEIFLGASGEGPLEVMIAAPADSKRLRIMLLRAVREVLASRAVARGALPLHGSAVAGADGRVTAFAGTRGSGKSTLLAHALGAPGARYVTNDRALLHGRPETPTLQGIPTIVKLRDGTLSLLPALGRALEAARAAGMPPMEQVDGEPPLAASAPSKDRAREGPPGISPARLRGLLGVEGVPGGPLAAIVLPRVDPSVEAYALARLDPREAACRLVREGGLTAGGSIAGFLAPSAPAPPSAEALEARLASICGRVACLSCALGPRAYEHDPPVREAIARAVEA